MRNFRNLFITAAIGLLLLVLSGCDSSDSSPSNLAPESIAGKTYSIAISAGAGVFASAGTVNIAVSETEGTYELTGDGINSGNSTGTFEYAAVGNSAAISVQDSVFGEGTFSLAFTDVNTGTYSATIVADPASSQSGVFTEVE